MKVKGIDISTWQENYPYKKAKDEGFEFAILRAGYGTKSKDNMFEEHYRECKKNGIKVGAYWYSYATSVDEVKLEAKKFLEVVKGKTFEYPLYYDLEDKIVLEGTDKTTRNNMVKAFGEIIEKAGYYFGVYTNTNWYRNHINGKELNKKYDWWLAQWSKDEPPKDINYGMWQYGGDSINYQRSDKIGGRVTDQNYCYKDYPTLINGGKKPKQVEMDDLLLDKLVDEIWDGKWGNGEERKTKLEKAGYDYDKVQARVNTRKPKKLKVGDIVEPITNVDYKGRNLHRYDEKYEILSIDDRGAVLGAVRQGQRPLWAVLKLDNIRRK